MSNDNVTKLTSRAGYWAFVNEGASDTQASPRPNETTSASNLGEVKRHPSFFFDDVLVSIQIENTLFNVHRYQLSKSEVFSDMFKLPKPEDDKPVEGSSPEHPIVIKSVAASDFTALLTVLYASQFSSDQPTPDISLLAPAFRLANMFNFSKLRSYLLTCAEEHLDDVEKIVFAKEFDIHDWLAPAHIRLCHRLEPLNEDEAGKLETGSVLIISRMREQHRSRGLGLSPSHYYCYACSGMSYHNNGFTCYGCNGANGTGYVRYNGPGRMAQRAAPIIDGVAIEAGINKWVEERRNGTKDEL